MMRNAPKWLIALNAIEIIEPYSLKHVCWRGRR